VTESPRSGVLERPRSWLFAFAGTLTLAMGASTFLAFALGVLAPLITADLNLSRASFGALITVMFLVGSLGSPAAGWLVDALGGRRVLGGLFLFAALSFLAAAAAPTYTLLLAVMTLGGLALAAGNPVTNKLVAAHVRLGRQGVVMGVKQSGVQVGAFLAGALLPAGALVFGWRGVLLASVALPAIGLAVTRLFVPPDPPMPSEHEVVAWAGLWSQVRWLVAYGFCMGLGVAALTAYLPLYAHEGVGLSVPAAGGAAATVGLVGIIARISWGHVADRGARSSQLLAIMAAGSVTSQLLLWGASPSRSALLWAGAVGIGASAGAWNAVGMLAIVKDLGVREAGRASGLVLLAFYGGYVVAPVAFGYSLDVTGAYDVGWISVTLSYVAAAVIAVLHDANRSRHVPTGA
jgi:predicted MFS family arabinose efflux permease